jgi:hypothetical protein
MHGPRIRGPPDGAARELTDGLGWRFAHVDGCARTPRLHWPSRWFVWVIVGLVAAGVGVGIDRAFFSGRAQPSWPPKPCVVQGIDARCGTFVVPENRTKPNGRTIGLRVVVLPAFLQPARRDAVAYLAGGPGSAATDNAASRSQQFTTLHIHRDILLVDQRGTGGSKRHDPT